MSPKHSFFATCAPGVEAVLHAEARALRLARLERQVGGVYFEGDLRAAWRANLWLRTAVRVLMRVQRFACADADALYAGAREVDWSRFLAPEGKLVVDAHTKESALDHSRFIEQRVKDAIVDRFRERTGARPSVDREQADVGVVAHLFRDRCTLLVDTSGPALHRRGWRIHQGPAPLAETLAAAVIQHSGWDGRAPLLDPFCGSGTILIEAALQAGGSAPGQMRRFNFERWPGHDRRAWEAERARAREGERHSAKWVLRGSDRDPKRIEEARANAAAAGVADRIDFSVAEAGAFAPRPGWNAWVVSNLPYGERVSEAAEVEALYARFGALLGERCAGYRLGLLVSAERADALGLKRQRSSALTNGGIECRLVLGELPG